MVESKCDLCIKQTICTIHPKTCDRDFTIFEKERLKEHDAKIRADAIDEFAEWLPKHFDLRFSNNPQVWVDEYFNHTSEKIIEQIKEQKNG